MIFSFNFTVLLFLNIPAFSHFVKKYLLKLGLFLVTIKKEIMNHGVFLSLCCAGFLRTGKSKMLQTVASADRKGVL